MTEPELSWYEYGLSGLLYDTANFITGDLVDYLPEIWQTETVEEFIELVETNRLPSDGAPKIFHNEVILQTILDLLDPKAEVVSLGLAFNSWSSHFFRICKIQEVLIFPEGLHGGPTCLVFMKNSDANEDLSIEERQLCRKAASGELESLPLDKFFNPVHKIYCNRSRLPNAFLVVRRDSSGFVFGDPESGGDAKIATKHLKDLDQVYSTGSAFLAVKLDRSLICWGNVEEGGATPEKVSDVKQVKENLRAFAILYEDGTVAATGDPLYGGAIHKQLDNILDLACNERAFWALAEDNSVETWGDPAYQYRDDKVKMDFSDLLTKQIS